MEHQRRLSPFRLMLGTLPLLAVLASWPAGATWMINYNTSAPVTDTIEAFIVSDTGAGPFDGDGLGFHPVNDPGWVASLVNPNYSLGMGPDDSSFNLELSFLGDQTQALTVDFLFWDDGSLVFGQRFSWNNGPVGVVNGLAAVSYPTGVGYNRATVPEPGILALLGAGLGGLAAIRRRTTTRRT